MWIWLTTHLSIEQNTEFTRYLNKGADLRFARGEGRIFKKKFF